MTQRNPQPPRITSISQCATSLDFQGLSKWPEGLPAVAINEVIIAGFEQNMVFNHTIPVAEKEKIASLFRSVYFELSFAEMSRLIQKAKKHPWLPVDLVAQKFGWQANESFFKIAQALVQTPIGFQNWCAEKKMAPMDLIPLVSADSLNLKSLFHDIIRLRTSKSLGAKVLELGIELMLLGKTVDEISAGDDLDSWLSKLTEMRYPNTAQKDSLEKEQMIALPWPGMSQAKWTRQGDKTGVELKLFVSQPADLKKYLQSLEKVQNLLEDLNPGTQH